MYVGMFNPASYFVNGRTNYSKVTTTVLFYDIHLEIFLYFFREIYVYWVLSALSGFLVKWLPPVAIAFEPDHLISSADLFHIRVVRTSVTQ